MCKAVDTLSIVILNYNTQRETNDCISSILNQRIDSTQEYKIIIVDNHSPDGSGAILNKMWSGGDTPNIYYLETDRNLGFANGMNKGILFSRNVLKIDNILLLNSDTILADDDFLVKLLKEIEPGIAVIGPKIVDESFRGAYKRLRMESYSSILKQAIVRNGFLFVYHHKALYSLWRKIKPDGREYVPAPRVSGNTDKEWGREISCDVWIPGCGFLLTEYYFEKYPILWPYTFMYCEEPIITLLCRKKGMMLKHLGSPCLMHLDGAATRKLQTDDDGRKVWQMRVWADSCKELCRVYRYSYSNVRKKMNQYLGREENGQNYYGTDDCKK